MSCSFDKKEYCPLEHCYDKSNIKWKLKSSAIGLSINQTLKSKSGGNYVAINGVFKKATMKTPLIQTKSKCLSFYYLINNYSKLEVNKVNLNGSYNKLFEKEVKSSSIFLFSFIFKFLS
jgi:hypothetical protein